MQGIFGQFMVVWGNEIFGRATGIQIENCG